MTNATLLWEHGAGAPNDPCGKALWGIAYDLQNTVVSSLLLLPGVLKVGAAYWCEIDASCSDSVLSVSGTKAARTCELSILQINALCSCTESL